MERAGAEETFGWHLSRLKKIETGVARLNAGKAAFRRGDYGPARKAFDQSLEAFSGLLDGVCRGQVDEAVRGRDETAEILAQEEAVDHAIDACDVDQLTRLLARHSNSKDQFRSQSVVRIRAALPKCVAAARRPPGAKPAIEPAAGSSPPDPATRQAGWARRGRFSASSTPTSRARRRPSAPISARASGTASATSTASRRTTTASRGPPGPATTTG